jgi:hypothetical protein
LGERSGITLPINHPAVGLDFSHIRKLAADRIAFVHDDRPRMPNLFERVAHNSIAGVSQARIFSAQHDGYLSGKRLLRAIDVTDVDDPYSD